MNTHTEVPFTELEAITRETLEHVGRHRVRVDRLNGWRHEVWGLTDGRGWVAFQDPAPLWVIAHELAHLLTGCDHEHPQWQTSFHALLPLVVAIAARRETTRLASLTDG